MKPEVLFLAYGMNDIEAQNGNASGFVKAYKNVDQRSEKVTAGYEDYVNCILPAAQMAIETRPLFANVPKFNQKLKKLCKKEKVTFIDNTDLVKQEYYADDGIHMSPFIIRNG